MSTNTPSRNTLATSLRASLSLSMLAVGGKAMVKVFHIDSFILKLSCVFFCFFFNPGLHGQLSLRALLVSEGITLHVSPGTAFGLRKYDDPHYKGYQSFTF